MRAAELATEEVNAAGGIMGKKIALVTRDSMSKKDVTKKNVTELIKGTVKKVTGGTELVASTTEAFTKVADSTSKVAELVGEIAAASNEQAQGVDQVNTAVTEMDKVTQQNAAGATDSSGRWGF